MSSSENGIIVWDTCPKCGTHLDEDTCHKCGTDLGFNLVDIPCSKCDLIKTVYVEQDQMVDIDSLRQNIITRLWTCSECYLEGLAKQS